jgi:hypothetical protein
VDGRWSEYESVEYSRHLEVIKGSFNDKAEDLLV